MLDEIPRKLLDCPEFQDLVWPYGFENLGKALRIDYTTSIHSPIKVWEPYRHRFSTGVDVYGPARTRHAKDGNDGGQVYDLPPSVDPIILGVVDRVYFVTPDGRQFIFSHPDAGVDEIDVTDSYLASDWEEARLLAWDVEDGQLVIASERGDVDFILRGGLLQLSDDGMIVG